MITPNHGRKLYPIIALLLVLLIAAGGYIMLLEMKQKPSLSDEPRESTQETITAIEPATGLADLGQQPNWTTLDLWQDTITHDDFLYLLTDVYTTDDSWKRFITIHPDHAIIRTDTNIPGATYRLNFASVISEASPNRNWNSVGELPPGTSDKPLAGVHIAIDPGHIGGNYAKIEERWFQIGDHPPVKEGDMTLLTGKIIKEQLIKLGAKVYLVRGSNNPVNPKRADDYREAAIAKASLLDIKDESSISSYQNKFFYRTGEIRERARRVNLAFNPDLVLCLHFNAEAWNDPAAPSLTDENHYHVLLHGALTRTELAHDDERFEMLVKILQRSHEEEKSLGVYMARSLATATKLPAYEYHNAGHRARQIEDAPGLWLRNLLANRIYQCPVIFLEPYVMNNQEVHDRIQLGDYKGTKLISGEERKSIFQEYADAVVSALEQYYLDYRIIYKPDGR
jgi:N-acetylmuramoyl-L-alanine amidase